MINSTKYKTVKKIHTAKCPTNQQRTAITTPIKLIQRNKKKNDEIRNAVAVIIFILWSSIIVCCQHHFVVTLDTWVRLSQIIVEILFSYSHLILLPIISIRCAREWVNVRWCMSDILHLNQSFSLSSRLSVALKQWQLFHVVIFLRIVIICGYEKKYIRTICKEPKTKGFCTIQNIAFLSALSMWIMIICIFFSVYVCVCLCWFTWMISFFEDECIILYLPPLTLDLLILSGNLIIFVFFLPYEIGLLFFSLTMPSWFWRASISSRSTNSINHIFYSAYDNNVQRNQNKGATEKIKSTAYTLTAKKPIETYCSGTEIDDKKKEIRKNSEKMIITMITKILDNFFSSIYKQLIYLVR